MAFYCDSEMAIHNFIKTELKKKIRLFDATELKSQPNDTSGTDGKHNTRHHEQTKIQPTRVYKEGARRPSDHYKSKTKPTLTADSKTGKTHNDKSQQNRL